MRNPASPPLIDPRRGDVEDDASSTKTRSLGAIAGSMLTEISLTRFVLIWVLLVALPGLALGFAPLIATAWLAGVSDKIAVLSGLGSIVLVALVGLAGLYGIRPLFRLIERSFWALHSVAVQPVYTLCREVISQFAEGLLGSDADEQSRTHRRAATAVAAGLVASCLAAAVVALVWQHTRWTGTLADLRAPLQLAAPALANAVAIVGLYLAAASLVWGVNDAIMDQPHKINDFDATPAGERTWRVAHLSDLHTVGERYGFRIESGRAGPRGNERLAKVFERLNESHSSRPLDMVLVTGDMTDAGRSSEWAEFLDHLAPFPALAERMLILPGNHDVNVVDRTNPARLELPISPRRQLRQMRTLSAMASIQGERVHVFDRDKGRIGATLAEELQPHRAAIADLADAGRIMISPVLAQAWANSFPQIVLPKQSDGLGYIILNSNAETNFSFTNALGLVPAEDVTALLRAISQFPKAVWVVALHHHIIEYPMQVKQLSVRIGTALINGSWFARQLQPVSKRLVVMHGHRHTDWIGSAGSLKIVSAPSPVMGANDHQPSHMHIHSLTGLPDGSLGLLHPERLEFPGIQPAHEAIGKASQT